MANRDPLNKSSGAINDVVPDARPPVESGSAHRRPRVLALSPLRQRLVPVDRERRRNSVSDQINVNSGGTRDSGTGGILAAILIIALIAFLVWAFAFGGFAALSGRPAVAPATSNAPAGPNISVKPNVNVNAPSGG